MNQPLPRNNVLNPYANERPEYEFRPVEGGFEVRGKNDEVLCRTAREEDARMLAFAGKLHWAVGNLSAFLKATAQDLRFLAKAGDASGRVANSLARLAEDAERAAHEGTETLNGALLTGQEAKAFDARWVQEYTSSSRRKSAAAPQPKTLQPMTAAELKAIKVRRTMLVCVRHPEWGTWGVMEDRGSHFEIRGDSGNTVLDKAEALSHWAIYRPETIQADEDEAAGVKV